MPKTELETVGIHNILPIFSDGMCTNIAAMKVHHATKCGTWNFYESWEKVNENKTTKWADGIWSKLMLHGEIDELGQYQCPFKIKTFRHPFVTVAMHCRNIQIQIFLSSGSSPFLSFLSFFSIIIFLNWECCVCLWTFGPRFVHSYWSFF